VFFVAKKTTKTITTVFLDAAQGLDLRHSEHPRLSVIPTSTFTSVILNETERSGV